MTQDEIKVHNEALARILVTTAEYIAMSDTPAKVTIGVDFRVRGKRFKLPPRPVYETMRTISLWASQEIVKVVQRYQEATGTKQGQELLDAFRQAAEELDKFPKR